MQAIAALSVVLFHVACLPAPDGVWAYLSQRNSGPPVTGVVLSLEEVQRLILPAPPSVNAR